MLGTDVGRDGIELVVGCMDVEAEVGPVVTIGDRVGRFVDGIDVVGVLVVCMGFDGASDDRFVGFVVGCGERFVGFADETIVGGCVGRAVVAIDVETIVGIVVAGTGVDGDCETPGLCVGGG